MINQLKVGLLVAAVMFAALNILAKQDIKNSVEWNSLTKADQQFLDKIQRKAFDYFWEGFEPESGLIADKHKGSRTSIANSGFGLSAFCIGVERGWVTRKEAYRRVLVTLNSYYKDHNDKSDFCVEGHITCWYNFRNKKDKYANHWEVAVNALKANCEYTKNWGETVGYHEELWGWTACAGRDGYIGFSKPNDGTLAPSAVIASKH